MAEGAPLLRAYRVKPIEGSNPSLSANFLPYCDFQLLSNKTSTRQQINHVKGTHK